MDKVTPRPWEVDREKIFTLNDRDGNRIIADLTNSSFPSAVCRANAAYIVRAVNLFDELVVVLDDEIQYLIIRGDEPAEKTLEVLARAKEPL